MIHMSIRCVLAAVLVAGVWSTGAWAAGAGPEVTVSISGSLGEMLPVLQLLRNMGFGFESPDDSDQALRLEVHSVVRDTDLLKDLLEGQTVDAVEDAPVEEAPEPEPQDTLGLYRPAVDPAAAAPGDTVTVSVVVVDPEGDVDTIGAELVGVAGSHADLYDDGTHGDEVASDGIWTRAMTLPDEILPGPHHIEVVAYDSYGDPVTDADGLPLRTRIPLRISR